MLYMKNKCLFLFVLVVLLMSCSKEEIGMNNSESQIEKERMNDVIKVQNINELYDIFCKNERCDNYTLKTMGDISVLSNRDSIFSPRIYFNVGEGYSKLKTIRIVPKMIFGKELADKFGVNKDLIYTVKYLCAEANVDTKGKTFFRKESPKCGYKPISSGGQESIDFETRGYVVRQNGDPTILATYLFYIDCIWSTGASVKKYYPCDPKSILWYYFIPM